MAWFDRAAHPCDQTPMRGASIVGPLLVAALTACAGARHGSRPDEPGIMLGVSDVAAWHLRAERTVDATIRDYVSREGAPDFIYRAGPTDVELIYVRASRLAHFHRTEPTIRSTVTELSPLPESVLALLSLERQPLAAAAAAHCWHVPIDRGSCRTCCRGTRRCATDCNSRAS